MKLKNLEFQLQWPDEIKLVSLRKFITSNILKEGELVRWSIIDIRHSKNSHNEKTLLINAVIII
tara:strand:+ start:2414 stop:2605 length:192 start_codon:yes stop_codon:yes gene_type:complete